MQQPRSIAMTDGDLVAAFPHQLTNDVRAVLAVMPEARIAGGRAPSDPVLGLVVLEAREDHLFLDSIAVHPDAHGRGVGRRLLHFVDARARALGLPEVRLYTHALMRENQKIYPKYGYEVVERRAQGRFDRLHYRKRLD